MVDNELDNERCSVEKLCLGSWRASRDRSGEGILVIQRYLVGLFDSILWWSRDFIFVKCALPYVLGDCLHYFVLDAHQASSRCCAFSKNFLSIDPAKHLNVDVGILVWFRYLPGRIAQKIHHHGGVVRRIFQAVWNGFGNTTREVGPVRNWILVHFDLGVVMRLSQNLSETAVGDKLRCRTF